MKKKKQPPRNDSVRELAKFWDHHDLMDFEDELEEVKEPVFERPATPLQVRLESKEAEALQRLARSKRVSASALIRQWIQRELAAGKSGRKTRKAG
jgi:hypothetical protein